MSSETLGALAAEGRAAFDRGDGESSRRAFEAALAEQEDAELLEGLARALYLLGDYRGSMEAHERAFAAFKAGGDAVGAARAARILSWLHLNVHGDWAVCNGWLARATSLLSLAGDEGLEKGWLELMHATREPYDETKQQRLRAALGIGRRFHDPDLEFASLAGLGEALVMTGSVEEGLLLLDESLAAICAGEVRDVYVVEGLFCGMFVNCERVHDIVRAEQWMRAAEELMQRRSVAPVGALCQAHYGGLLTAAGRWDEAETQLTQAARRFERSYAAARAIVFVRLADLRVRQGRLEEAATFLDGMDQIPDAARPLAALRLARGETALARDLLERRLSAPALPAPWPVATTTPIPPPIAGPLLALLVDVCLAETDLSGAAEVTARLDKLARSHSSLSLAAYAALAKGRLCLAVGEGDAEVCLRDALAAFALAQMPVELARARLELAKAVAAEQPEVAVAEAKAALEAFELRAAARDADAAAALLRSLGAAGRTAPRLRTSLSKREHEVLELLALGLSNPEIARRLFISPKTAEHHVRHILGKLGLRNRAEAAAYSAREAARRPGAK